MRVLALANTIGGDGWILAIAAWWSLDPGGRAVLGTTSGAFLMVAGCGLLGRRDA